MNQTTMHDAALPVSRVRHAWLRCFLALAYALAFALFFWWMDRRMLGVARGTYFGWFVLGNALPGLVFAALLTALTRRPGVSFLIAFALQWLVYHACAMKLAILDDPIGLQDLYFVTSLNQASIAVLGRYIEHPVLLALGALAAVALIAFAWWIEKPAFRAFRATQLALMVLSAGLIYTMVASLPPWSSWYHRGTLRPSRFEAMPAILHGGLMSYLVYTHNKNMRTLQTVDPAAVRSLLAKVPVTTTPVAADAVRPDVVVILSESLFDSTIMKGMAGLPETLPNVRASIAQGHGGYMKVPTFGGGTIRTEFEVMTGMPMDAFPNAQFPYVTLVREHIPGLVSELKKHGYRAIAVHGNDGSFWNRTNAYKAIGFDRFITKREFPKNAAHNGRWISDAVMTDIILDQLARATGPTFVLGLSMESHGPYTDEKTTDQAARDAVRIPPGLTPDEALELRNYLYHAHRADAQFARLLAALEARKRPTVLLFFGDHLPGLRKVFQTTGFNDNRPAVKQYVPWVLVRTDRPEHKTVPHAESWMLPGMVLQLAGFDDDPYFALTNGLSQRLSPESKTLPPALARGLNAAAVARIQGSFATYAKEPARRRGGK
jgi:phosphoglycerol transferase MdoB-like AlkP superfamily enzyme